MNGFIEGLIDCWIDGFIRRLTDERLINGWTDGLIDELIDG